MKSILIIGSGIVGICSGIELINRGYTVTLMDPNKPGSQTSYGNAGVITDASLMIVNNPQLLKSLFSLIFKDNSSIIMSICAKPGPIPPPVVGLHIPAASPKRATLLLVVFFKIPLGTDPTNLPTSLHSLNR